MQTESYIIAGGFGNRQHHVATFITSVGEDGVTSIFRLDGGCVFLVPDATSATDAAEIYAKQQKGKVFGKVS